MKSLVLASVRSFSRFCIAISLVCLSASAMAQQPIRVAVLDMSAALFNTEIAKQLDQQIQEETAEDQAKVRDLAEQITELQQKREKDAAVMSQEEQRKNAEKIEELGVQYQFLVQKLQELVQQRRQQFQQAYRPNLVEAITEVVEEDNYDIVLRAETTLHWRSSYDITARVTEKLNAQQQQ